MFGVILILLNHDISLKSTYQVIHEALCTGPRSHQVLRGYVVHLKWSMVWRWRAQGGTPGYIADDVFTGCLGQVLQRAKKNVEAGEDEDDFRANSKVRIVSSSDTFLYCLPVLSHCFMFVILFLYCSWFFRTFGWSNWTP